MVGNGNVAMDLARILASPPEASWRPPTSPSTRSRRWPRAGSAEIHVLGRRGPAQAAFTNKELRSWARSRAST